MNSLRKKVTEISDKFRFEVMTTELKHLIEKELIDFINDTFPNIGIIDKYIVIENAEIDNSKFSVILTENFKNDFIKHYPEEFI